MRDENVGVNAEESGNECLEELLLSSEQRQSVRLAGLAEALLQVVWPRFAAVPSDHAEPLDALLIVRWTVLIDL